MALTPLKNAGTGRRMFSVPGNFSGAIKKKHVHTRGSLILRHTHIL